MSTASEAAAAALYDTAIRHLDDVIKTIEDLPVSGLLLDDHSRTAVRLLRDAYDLWRGLTAARDALTKTG